MKKDNLILAANDTLAIDTLAMKAQPASPFIIQMPPLESNRATRRARTIAATPHAEIVDMAKSLEAIIQAIRATCRHRNGIPIPYALCEIVGKTIAEMIKSYNQELTAGHLKQCNDNLRQAIKRHQIAIKPIGSSASQVLQEYGEEYLKRIKECEQTAYLPLKANKPHRYFITQIYFIMYEHLRIEPHTRLVADILAIMGIECSEQTISKTLTPAKREEIRKQINELAKQREQQRNQATAKQQAELFAVLTNQQKQPPKLSDSDKLKQILELLRDVKTNDFRAIAEETETALLESLAYYGVSLPE